jgi:hypothetical protein
VESCLLNIPFLPVFYLTPPHELFLYPQKLGVCFGGLLKTCFLYYWDKNRYFFSERGESRPAGLHMKDKIDMSLVKAYAPLCITLLILCLVPRHADMPSWIKWGIGIFGALSILNCFLVLAGMKKKASAPLSKSEEEKKPGPDS